ncbi:MAG: DUF885 family protein [Lachnospiraceae bacterium]|nr:DUF885 family protein [Lachnospiraceae bacterium]
MKRTKRGAALLALILSLSLLLSGCYLIPAIEDIFHIQVTEAPSETPRPTETVRPTEGPRPTQEPVTLEPVTLEPVTSEPATEEEPYIFDEKTEQAFKAFTDGIFASILQDAGTLSVHFYCAEPERFGIDMSEVTWPSMDWSDEAEDEYRDQLDGWMKELDTFKRSSLSEEGRFMYDTLKAYLTLEYDSFGYTFYYEPLSSSGVQAYLPIELAQYTLNDKADVEEYLTLIETMPDYFDGIIAYEQAKSAAGYFMEDRQLDEVLDQCKDLVGELELDDCFMVTLFEQRLDRLDLTDAEKQAYMERNAEVLEKGMGKAYQSLIDALEPLRSTGKYKGNLSSLPKGKEYYEYLVASSTGTTRTVSELISLVEKKIREGMTKIRDLAASSPQIYRYEDGDIYPTTDPTLCLRMLEEKTKDIFPTVEGIDYAVDYVDDSLRDYLSPAMYMLKPYGSTVRDSILINCDKGDEPDDIFITLAHEGYPGHMLQTNYLISHSEYPLRYLLQTNGYTEGYATYVELYSYSFLQVPTAVQEYYSVLAEVTLYLYARADLGIEYQGWDAKKTGNYMANYFEDPDAIGDWMYGHICGDPGGYLDYAIGMIEIRDLYNAAKKQGMDDMQFHTRLLDLAGAPFELIGKHLFD